MDWKTVYRPERRASASDIADAIRASVTLENALDTYCPSLPRKHRRCPCPIHNGTDFNFSYNTNWFKCFVCGAGGDVISFVKEVCELSTRLDAMRKIDHDFNLRLYDCAGFIPEVSEKVKLARAEAERKRQAREAWETQYHKLSDEWVRLDRVRREADPFSDEYAEAVKNLDRVAFELDSMPAEPG